MGYGQGEICGALIRKVHISYGCRGQAFSSVHGVREDITGNVHIVGRRDKGALRVHGEKKKERSVFSFPRERKGD